MRPAATRLALVGLLATAVPVGLVAAGSSVADTTADTPSWSAWTSSPTDSAARLQPRSPVDTPATRVLEVTPSDSHQTWRGAGAALTDSARKILQNSPAATSLLFDPARADGAKLNLVRVPLSATDFSTTAWAFGWNDATGALTPPTVASANAAFLKNQVLPLVPDLKAVAAGWSAPADMKDTGTLNGGSLKSTSTAAYGRMLIAQADWLKASGVPLHAMSLGNEPFHSTTGYPTMLMSTSQMSALGNQISTSLNDRGVQLWAVDHNWEHRSQYDTVLAGAPGAFDAAAFHCYGGSVGQMYGVAVPPVMTECTGTNDGFSGTFRWDAANLIVGAVNAGSTGLMMWNLALDENHGPHTGGCGTCRGVIDVNSVTGAVAPTPEFYALAHVSRAADPGAVVIGAGTAANMPFAAFRNPDGRTGIVGHNDTGSDQVVAAATNGIESTQRFLVRAGELFTLRGWPDITAGSVDLPAATPAVGTPYTASTTGWEPGEVTLTKQWLANGQPIVGATSSTFTPAPAQAGLRLSLRVIGSRIGYRPVTVVSASSQPVFSPEPEVESVENLLRPEVAGTAKVGRTLTADAGTWTPSHAVLTYQWLRGGAPISNATSSSYLVRPSDVGQPIAVRLTGASPGMTPDVVTSRQTNPVVLGTIAVTSRGQILGILRVRRTLRVSGISTKPGTAFTYQWRRSGVRITGATRANWKLVRADRRKRMSVRVTLRAAGYASVSYVLTRSSFVR